MRAKRLIVCADDFGMAPGINSAILELININRISAASCMTVMRHWPAGAKDLKKNDGNVQLGLHVTLTNHNCCGPMPDLAPNGKFPSLAKLFQRAVSRRLDVRELVDEIERQMDLFYTHIGRPPDFIDGHHHVHQFPVIRDAIVEVVRRNAELGRLWVRVCWEPVLAQLVRRQNITKSLAIGYFGRRFRGLLDTRGINHNSGFVGIYDYHKYSLNEKLMARFLLHSKDGTLMMCHPGRVDEELKALDDLQMPREIEYKFLSGPGFPEELKRNGFRLSTGRPGPPNLLDNKSIR